MSDSSDDETFEEHFKRPKWIFYRDRKEWKDVTPVAQDDGPHPIVAIAYSDKCQYILIYFIILKNLLFFVHIKTLFDKLNLYNIYV